MRRSLASLSEAVHGISLRLLIMGAGPDVQQLGQVGNSAEKYEELLYETKQSI